MSSPADKLVLLVDDDESLLDLMTHVVKKEGFRTERAMDGEEALAKVVALSPDAIVLDFMLPGMGGYEALRELQSRGFGQIPIIVVTSYALSGDEGKAREAGCDAYVTKPYSPRQLLAKIREYLPK